MTDSSQAQYNEVIQKWDELEGRCDTRILRGIFAYGFEAPSPIQQKAILPMIARRDIVAQAQSGTGKTGCFTIGTLANIDTNKKVVQAILLAPTRELAMQTKSVVDALGQFINGLTTQLLVGGTSIDEANQLLKTNTPHIIIGCPGRIFDMLSRKRFSTQHLKLIVLDEADEMLSTGFKEQVYNIFEFMPKDIQVALFSATMPSDLITLTDRFMREPLKVLVKSEQLTLEGIKQYYISLRDDEDKFLCIKDIFESVSIAQCIIYCNSVRRVQLLYDAMKNDNFPVCQIHSGMDKKERMESYKSFITGVNRVMISSDVTARGIDVQQVSTVINFDLPYDVHTYIHRIGRSGRWGRKGLGINFVSRNDLQRLKEFESYYNTIINEMPNNWAEHVGN